MVSSADSDVVLYLLTSELVMVSVTLFLFRPSSSTFATLAALPSLRRSVAVAQGKARSRGRIPQSSLLKSGGGVSRRGLALGTRGDLRTTKILR